MASVSEEITNNVVEDKLSKLSVDEHIPVQDAFTNSSFDSYLSGFKTRELYKLALGFYKEKEGKAVHISYEDKLKLVAYTQQVCHGKYTPEKSPELGVLDVIGRDRKTAWQNLGDITKEEAMNGFIVLLDKICPLFKTYVEAQKRDVEEKARLKKEEELRLIEENKKLKELEEERKKEEEERMKQEHQRRQIQDALNQQTYYQFKSYAEQQYPGNPEEQGNLIRQLQEQHYHQYMQQLQRSQLVIEEKESDDKDNISDASDMKLDDDSLPIISSPGSDKEDSDDAEDESIPKIMKAEMWTNKNIEDFKNTIKREAGDAVIKVGHGETVTVRVPTHEDGSCLFWEFATDGYDIGFGVYFEWSKPETTQVSVHISESEDEDEDEDEDYETRDDLECGEFAVAPKSDFKSSISRISIIVPIYRRDSQEEVYAGSHKYPGQGVYLLKFDNSYSLWRSKTLYYRVYYTRSDVTKD